MVIDEDMVMDFSPLISKRVLVTGHTGFKGAWLSQCLQRLKCEILGVSLDDHHPRGIFRALHMAPTILSKHFDISDYACVTETIQEFRPDIIFHLAAQSIVRHAYRDPISTFRDNILGTAHVLYAAMQQPQPIRIVNVTSDKCYRNTYRNTGNRAYREDDPLGGRDPYSASKACAEIVASSLAHSFAKDRIEHLVCVRAGNVIGGGDYGEGRIIPDAIRAIHAQKPLTLRNPQSVRPWQHVLDPIAGYMMVAAAMFRGDPVSPAYNFGPNPSEDHTVMELITTLQSHLRVPDITIEAKTSFHEEAMLKLDSSLATSELGWRPQYDLRQSVQLTAAWYDAQLHHPKGLKDITQRQIDTLMAPSLSHS